ncbi:unnamed protein product, partial [Mesorhabditis belari]|uniref:Cyclin-like domain-containing protein n=1 Tax=Mesorhabditis belari TaxID=2138241 RepID=A0AAF3EDD2_9BILA
MFPTSTQKTEWTFDNTDALTAKRNEASENYKNVYREVINPGEDERFLSPQDESTMRAIVQEAALKFGDDFQPHLFPSVRYTAFCYFKRFFLKHTVMEYSPKMVMMACYYLATKIDEFYVPIHEFVANLKSGNTETNTSHILKLEPEILKVMDYSLIVYTPYRTIEGIFVEMKQRMALLNFDIESLRPTLIEFITKSLLSDVMLIFSPNYIALAALKYGLDAQDRAVELVNEFLRRMLGVDESQMSEKDNTLVKNIDAQLDQIIAMVEESARPVDADMRKSCMERCTNVSILLSVLEERRRLLPSNKNGANKFDSDED